MSSVYPKVMVSGFFHKHLILFMNYSRMGNPHRNHNPYSEVSLLLFNPPLILHSYVQSLSDCAFMIMTTRGINVYFCLAYYAFIYGNNIWKTTLCIARDKLILHFPSTIELGVRCGLACCFSSFLCTRTFELIRWPQLWFACKKREANHWRAMKPFSKNSTNVEPHSIYIFEW